MVLRKIDQQILKVNRKKITKYWIADKSGSAFLNVYDLDDNVIRQGDVYYLSGAYAQLFKGMMNIHQGIFALNRRETRPLQENQRVLIPNQCTAKLQPQTMGGVDEPKRVVTLPN